MMQSDGISKIYTQSTETLTQNSQNLKNILLTLLG